MYQDLIRTSGAHGATFGATGESTADASVPEDLVRSAHHDIVLQGIYQRSVSRLLIPVRVTATPQHRHATLDGNGWILCTDFAGSRKQARRATYVHVPWPDFRSSDAIDLVVDRLGFVSQAIPGGRTPSMAVRVLSVNLVNVHDLSERQLLQSGIHDDLTLPSYSTMRYSYPGCKQAFHTPQTAYFAWLALAASETCDHSDPVKQPWVWSVEVAPLPAVRRRADPA